MRKIHQKNKKKTIITVVAVVAAILFGLWLIGRYQVGQDADKFTAFKSRKDTVATSLSDYQQRTTHLRDDVPSRMMNGQGEVRFYSYYGIISGDTVARAIC
jgi:hypothetical protein